MNSLQSPASSGKRIAFRSFMRAAKARYVIWSLAAVAAILPNIGEIIKALQKSEYSSGPITGTLASIFLITSVGFYDAWRRRKYIATDKTAYYATLGFGVANSGTALYLLYLSNFFPQGFSQVSPIFPIAILLWDAISLTMIGEAWIAIENLRWPEPSN